MMKLLTLSCLVAVAEGMSSLAANATDIVKTPNPAWSRSPHMAPGMENEKGHVDVGGLPAPVEGQVPASPGVYRKANIHSRMPSGTDELIKNDPNDNRTEAEKRPLLANPAVVLMPEGPSAYNSSGASASASWVGAGFGARKSYVL
jgi:hypothetical protein